MAANYQARLARPLTPTGHAPLETLADASAFMLALPKPEAAYNAWQSAAARVLAAAENPTPEAIDAATFALELALFTTYRLELAG